MISKNKSNPEYMKIRADEKHRKTALADFSVLFDTDIGCCIYLLKNVTNKSVFEDHILSTSYAYIQYKVLTRQEENPIRFMFKDEYKSSADDIYKDLFDKKWDSILKESPYTDFLQLLASATKVAKFIVTVNCRNKQEKKYILSIFPTWSTVINETDFDVYFSLYLHDITTLVKNGITGKVVNLYGYALNYSKYDIRSNNINELSLPFINSITFSLIKPFKDFDLPEL